MKLILIIYMVSAYIFFACCGFALLLSAGCTDNGSGTYKQDGNYGPAWWDDKANAPYAHVSKSAPESLKPYYDPELTRSLNQRTYTVYPTWKKWLIDPLHYDSSVW